MRVLLFSSAKTACGEQGQLDIHLDAPTEVKMILNDICRRYPDLKGVLSKSMVAVNQQYVDIESSQVSPTDEVAIIPPVSGG